MVFTSPVFLYLFLPLFLIVYYAIDYKYKNAWILLGSWIFYSFWRPDFLVLLIIVTFISYIAGKEISKSLDNNKRKIILGISVVLELGILAYFKYFNFGVDSFNSLLSVFGIAQKKLWDVVLPVGISFYVFQAVSYIVDVYRKDAQASDSFVDIAAFISLFPQLVAGPILRYKDLATQLKKPEISNSNVIYGLERFVIGLCKKVLIADTLAPISNAIFNLNEISCADAWFGSLSYTVQLYFDFSGYSDMAIGLGYLMGFCFMENFDTPYRAITVTDFWKRWHISLSSWLRDYLYIPLGGNRKGKVITYINLFLVMSLGGLWHGASWNFVLWGVWCGLWLALEKITNTTKAKGMIVYFRWLLTQIIFIISLIIFGSPTLAHSAKIIRALFGVTNLSCCEKNVFSSGFRWQFGYLEIAVFVIAIFVIAFEPRASSKIPTSVNKTFGFLRLLLILFLIIGLVTCLIKISADGFSPFLYFRF